MKPKLKNNQERQKKSLPDGIPIVILKRLNLSELPYIVGCKDRPVEDLPKKRAKRGKKLIISKSIFDEAKSDEFAARPKECDIRSDENSDSNKNVASEHYTPISGRPRSFSPIPSTSKDSETFVKNDQRFNQSHIFKIISKRNIDDVEIFKKPCEIIERNDEITYNNTSYFNGYDGSTQNFEDKLIASSNTVLNRDLRDLSTDDFCVEVLDKKTSSPIIIEEYYSNLDIEYVRDDVDETQKFIEKYDKLLNLIAKLNKLVDTGSINTINLNEIVKLTGTNEITNSNRNSLTNEQPSAILVNYEELSHRPIVENGSRDNNVDVDGSNHHSIQMDSGSQNRTEVESLKNSQPFAPSHRFICSTERRGTDQQHNDLQSCCTTSNPQQSNPLPRMCSSTLNNDSYQQQLKMTHKFFKHRNREKTGKRIGECPICMYNYASTKKTFVSTTCGHIFCMDCLKLSIRSHGNKCPTCRKTIKKKSGYHEIFL